MCLNFWGWESEREFLCCLQRSVCCAEAFKFVTCPGVHMHLVPVCYSVCTVLADTIKRLTSSSSSVLLAGSNSVDEQGVKVRYFLCSLDFAPHDTGGLSVELQLFLELQCCLLGESHKRALFLFEHGQCWLCLQQESITILPVLMV